MQVTHFERITVNPNQIGGVPCIRVCESPLRRCSESSRVA
jgi:hypothetical protein